MSKTQLLLFSNKILGQSGGGRIDVNSLMQEDCFGLMEAISHLIPEHGVNFITCAVWGELENLCRKWSALFSLMTRSVRGERDGSFSPAGSQKSLSLSKARSFGFCFGLNQTQSSPTPQKQEQLCGSAFAEPQSCSSLGIYHTIVGIQGVNSHGAAPHLGRDFLSAILLYPI